MRTTLPESAARSVACLATLLAAPLLPVQERSGPAPRPPAGRAPAAPAEGLAPLLPGDTIALLSVPDLAGTLRDLRSLPIGKMAAEPSIQEFLEEPLRLFSEEARKAVSKAEESSGLPLLPLYESVGRLRSIEVALTRLGVRGTEGSLEAEFGLVARVDAGEAWPALRALLEESLGKVEAAGAKSGLTVSRAQGAGGATFARLSMTKEEAEATVFWKDGGSEIHLAFASASTGLVEDLWKRAALGAKAPSLAEDADFLACARRCGSSAGTEIRGFVRFGPLFDSLLDLLGAVAEAEEDLPSFLHPGPVKGLLDVLGLRGMRAAAFASTAAGDYSVNEIYVLAPAPRRGLLGVAEGEPVDRALLRFVPEKATSFSVGRLGLACLWDTLEEALPALGEELEGKVREALEGFEAKHGVQVRDDLLASIADEYVSYSLPTKGIMTVPEQAILVRLVDAERFERAATALGDALAGMTDAIRLREREYEGTKIRSFSIAKIPGGREIGGEPNPFAQMAPIFSLLSPAYAVVKETDETGAVTGGTLLLSLNATSLRQAIRRLGGEPEGGGESIEGFRRFAGQIPEKVASLAYSDDRSDIGVLYAMVTSFVPMLASVAGDKLPFDLTNLPPGEAITKHLFGEVSYTTADGEGIYGRAFSPWGVDTMAFLTGGIAGGAALLALHASPAARGPLTYPPPSGTAKGPEAAARADLRDLTAGISIYRLERGTYPPSLGSLLETSPEYPDGLLYPRNEVPQDPWGRAYVYEILEGGKAYRLRSAGPNGEDEGGEGDDVLFSP